jgi:hypothetical protein
MATRLEGFEVSQASVKGRRGGDDPVSRGEIDANGRECPVLRRCDRDVGTAECTEQLADQQTWQIRHIVADGYYCGSRPSETYRI